MATHAHHHPIRQFATGHPYAPDWLLLLAWGSILLLLWIWHS
jgi:hypothetical protein